MQWQDPVAYGLRAFLEEIVAMLIFVSVACGTSAMLLRGSQDTLVALMRRPRLLTLIALALWPVLVAATFELPEPGGPADWLASTLLLACALLAVRAGLLAGGFDSRALSLILFHVAASAAACAVKLEWDPAVLGASVSVRGIVFALLVVTGVAVLKANGRRLKAPRTLLVAATIAASAILWPSSQLVWCGLPPVLALWLYRIESKAAAEGGIARNVARSLASAAAPMH